MKVKADSFVVETNIHFPTDISLLWDSGRKVFDMLFRLKKTLDLAGWREAANWLKKLKKAYRKCAEIHRKKGRDYSLRLQKAAEEYLKICRLLILKVAATLQTLSEEKLTPSLVAVKNALKAYNALLIKHVDLLNRRVILGEKIPHKEKLFSIFEQHTEWISKGKEHKKVELGRNVCIVTDQHQFILYHYIMKKEVDKQITIKISDKIVELYPPKVYSHDSISYDRGFYSILAKTAVQKQFKLVVLPKPGKKSTAVLKEESSPSFIATHRKHSAVEAHINQVEHNGLDKCPDKGEHNFKRYVALGVLSYNLKRLGNLLLSEQQKKGKTKRRKRA